MVKEIDSINLMVLALVQLVDCSNWFLVLLFSSPFSCGKIVYDKNPFLAKDAKWETEGEAFEDLLERPNRCDAPVCLCPEGREYVLTNTYTPLQGRFDLSFSRHQLKLHQDNQEWLLFVQKGLQWRIFLEMPLLCTIATICFVSS